MHPFDNNPFNKGPFGSPFPSPPSFSANSLNTPAPPASEFNAFPNPRLNNSLDNLLSTQDPRSMVAQNANHFLRTGIGNPASLLKVRLAQIDPRDQEAHDIRILLDGKLW